MVKKQKNKYINFIKNHKWKLIVAVILIYYLVFFGWSRTLLIGLVIVFIWTLRETVLNKKLSKGWKIFDFIVKLILASQVNREVFTYSGSISNYHPYIVSQAIIEALLTFIVLWYAYKFVFKIFGRKEKQ